MDTMLVDELDAGDALASLGRRHRVRKSAESAIFVLVAHLADLYNPDSRPSGPRDSGGLPGRERTRRFGGQGTPLVWEFAVADLAVELEMSTAGARFLVKDVLDTRHRLPRLWERVCADEVKVGYARHVAQATHHLSVEAAGFVDAAVAESADGRITWSRFEAVVAGKVLALQPRPRDGRGTRGRGCEQAVREGNPVQRARDERVLPAFDHRGDRPVRRHRDLPRRSPQSPR